LFDRNRRSTLQEGREENERREMLPNIDSGIFLSAMGAVK
jgi:hypothetical protein